MGAGNTMSPPTLIIARHTHTHTHRKKNKKRKKKKEKESLTSLLKIREQSSLLFSIDFGHKGNFFFPLLFLYTVPFEKVNARNLQSQSKHHPVVTDRMRLWKSVGNRSREDVRASYHILFTHMSASFSEGHRFRNPHEFYIHPYQPLSIRAQLCSSQLKNSHQIRQQHKQRRHSCFIKRPVCVILMDACSLTPTP
ncbi:hypothetical protein CEXT_65021 [Caerostris extrusa]|uniref:Uncharacterized protein n=1 Tax=Caerostris extrusa TaxID=172846 RepID=A0AAV4WFG5_CAEEX|nr:hypothetical protein CEXT_65021 [Caerostris extrusa]